MENTTDKKELQEENRKLKKERSAYQAQSRMMDPFELPGSKKKSGFILLRWILNFGTKSFFAGSEGLPEACRFILTKVFFLYIKNNILNTFMVF